MNAPRGSIWSVDKTFGGWLIIRGIIGPRRYLYYSKCEAIRRYRKEVIEKRLVYGNSVIYADGKEKVL